MRDFTLSRSMIGSACGWGYRIVRGILENPYRLRASYDPPSYKGGGRLARYRLSDVLTRARLRPDFKEEMAARLVAADAAFRQSKQ